MSSYHSALNVMKKKDGFGDHEEVLRAYIYHGIIRRDH